MKLFKLVALLVGSAIVCGCATAPSISKDVTQSLKGSKVAVAYTQLNKKIHYKEDVYKVFWIETRTKEVSFDGLWDIDSDLSEYVAPKVCEIGLKAVSIYDVVPKDEVIALHETLKTKMHEDPLVLSESLRSKLIDNGIDYLIAVNSSYIRAEAAMGIKLGDAHTRMYLQDVRSNEEKLDSHLYCGGSFKVEGSIRKIEDNNLVGLKVAMKGWLDKSIHRFMAKQLGLVE